MTLHIAGMLQDLAQNEVDYILASSFVDTAPGANPVATEIAIIPSLDIDNLHRLARCFYKSQVTPLDKCKLDCADVKPRQWSPYPVSVQRIKGLFETRNGPLKVIVLQNGTYNDREREACQIVVQGIHVRVARRMYGSTSLVGTAQPIVNNPLTTDDPKSPSALEESKTEFIEKPAQCLLTERALAAACGICRSIFGDSVRLRLHESIIAEPGYRSAIFRCRVDGTSSGLPKTVVVKRSNRCEDNLLNEWAAFEFLGRFSGLSAFVPRFFGGDVKAKLIVMEDLGDIRECDLASYLVTDKTAVTKDFLIRFAGLIGTIQGATASRLHEFQEIRTSLPPAKTEACDSDQLVESLGELRSHCESLGVSIPAGFDDEIRSTIRELDDPGPFLVFSSGDFCTKNAAFVGEHVMTFDFERARFQHALIDGTFGWFRHLCCLYAGRLPLDIQLQMDAAYRDHLKLGCPAASDDRLYAFAVAAASAGWLARMLRNIPDALEKDKKRGSASARQRILACLDAFQFISGHFSQLECIGAISGSLSKKLADVWPTDELRLPLFPVFESDS